MEIKEQIELLGLLKVNEHDSEEVNREIFRLYGCGWRKYSIFWDLPYWSSNLIHHNLDVMHIEKNVFENVFNTVMNIEGKTKDTWKAREDMTLFCQRKELEKVGNGVYPKANYSLDKNG